MYELTLVSRLAKVYFAESEKTRHSEMHYLSNIYRT